MIQHGINGNMAVYDLLQNVDLAVYHTLRVALIILLKNSSVPDTPRNGDSTVYHTLRNGDLVVYDTPQNGDLAVYLTPPSKWPKVC